MDQSNNGQLIPYKRLLTYNSCRYRTIKTSGACARKLVYSLNTFKNIKLITSRDDDPMRKELRSLFKKRGIRL